MIQDDDGSSNSSTASYEEALDALSSLITKRTRCDKSGDRFDLLFDYIKVLDLEEPISKMKVIHVAGTKGKGSTCTFTESILRNCGFHTGLFTSPHLIDVRERFRLDGVDISEDKFLVYFWWCYERLKENTNENLPMPSLFRFLALLAFKIFSDEKVDVAILEVGLGGIFDATNVVQAPIVCGICSLGYDHMEILGNTLGEIAAEKAGIFKCGVPAFTVYQPDEAMHVLKTKADTLNLDLQVVPPLDVNLLKGLKLGLDGEHQYINAGLAIALCSTWLQRTGNFEFSNLELNSLPEQFLHGLTTVSFDGRAQIVADRYIKNESPGDLVFYLDGAHSPESMEACGKWFSLAIQEDEQQHILNHQSDNSYTTSNGLPQENHDEKAKDSMQILVFNCMSVRDPQLLLPPLIKTCADQGVHFKMALFTPNTSVYHKVGTHTLPQSDTQVDLSWQFKVQRVWENLMQIDKGLIFSVSQFKKYPIFISIYWLQDMSKCLRRVYSCLYVSDADNLTKMDCVPNRELSSAFIFFFNNGAYQNDGISENTDLNFSPSYGNSLTAGSDSISQDGLSGGKIDEAEIGVQNCENSCVFSSLSSTVKWLRATVRQNRSVRVQVLVTGSLHLVGDVLRLVK